MSFLVVLGRAYDVFTTYLYTPDLTNETNILVKYMGAGWTIVLIVQSLLVAITIALLYFYLFRFKLHYPKQKDLNLKQFISYLFFGNTSSFSKVFYKMPNDKNVLLAYLGYIVSATLIASSFVVGTSTTFLLISDSYRQWYKLGIPYLLFAVIIAFAALFTLRFFKIEYRKYRSSQDFSS